MTVVLDWKADESGPRSACVLHDVQRERPPALCALVVRGRPYPYLP